MYSIVNKFHFVVHLAEQGRFMNPKKFWTYMMEDFVGLMIKIAQAETPGTSVLNMSEGVAHRFATVTHIRLSRGCEPH